MADKLAKEQARRRHRQQKIENARLEKRKSREKHHKERKNSR